MTEEKTEVKAAKKKGTRRKMPSPDVPEQVSNVFDLKISDGVATPKGMKITGAHTSDTGDTFVTIELMVDVSANGVDLPAAEAVRALTKESARINEGKHDMKLSIRRDYQVGDFALYHTISERLVTFSGQVKGDPRVSFAEGEANVRFKVKGDLPADRIGDLAWMIGNEITLNVKSLQADLFE